MKGAVIIILFAFCSVECRKIVQINKNANLDFINMEAGGRHQPAPPAVPVKPITPPQSPTQAKAPSSPVTPKVVPTPVVTAAPKPLPQPIPTPSFPNQKPVQPMKPSIGPVTTPGPGSVKSLVNFYDSQGKASPIRPYSYSDAVKKGKQ